MNFPKGLEIRWYMSKELAEWLTQPVWEYVQRNSSIWEANVLSQTKDSENLCDQLIEIGRLLEHRKQFQSMTHHNK